MKVIQKLLSLLLCVIIPLSIVLPVYAQSTTVQTEESSATAQYEGFENFEWFLGTSADLYLDSDNYTYHEFATENVDASSVFYRDFINVYLSDIDVMPSEDVYYDVLLYNILLCESEGNTDIEALAQANLTKSTWEEVEDGFSVALDIVGVGLDSDRLDSIKNVFDVIDKTSNVTADTTEFLSDLLVITEKYTSYIAILDEIIAYEGKYCDEEKIDAQVKERVQAAATTLSANLDDVLTAKIYCFTEYATDASEEYCNLISSLLIGVDIIDYMNELEEFADNPSFQSFGSCVIDVAAQLAIDTSQLKIGLKIGQLIGNITADSENANNRVMEIIACDVVSQIMVTVLAETINEYSAADLSGDEEAAFLAVESFKSQSLFLLELRLRGEYSIYTLITEDSGLFSDWANYWDAFADVVNSLGTWDHVTTYDEWFEATCEVLLDLEDQVNNIQIEPYVEEVYLPSAMFGVWNSVSNEVGTPPFYFYLQEEAEGEYYFEYGAAYDQIMISVHFTAEDVTMVSEDEYRVFTYVTQYLDDSMETTSVATNLCFDLYDIENGRILFSDLNIADWMQYERMDIDYLEAMDYFYDVYILGLDPSAYSLADIAGDWELDFALSDANNSVSLLDLYGAAIYNENYLYIAESDGSYMCWFYHYAVIGMCEVEDANISYTRSGDISWVADGDMWIEEIDGALHIAMPVQFAYDNYVIYWSREGTVEQVEIETTTTESTTSTAEEIAVKFWDSAVALDVELFSGVPDESTYEYYVGEYVDCMPLAVFAMSGYDTRDEVIDMLKTSLSSEMSALVSYSEQVLEEYGVNVLDVFASSQLTADTAQYASSDEVEELRELYDEIGVYVQDACSVSVTQTLENDGKTGTAVYTLDLVQIDSNWYVDLTGGMPSVDVSALLDNFM